MRHREGYRSFEERFFVVVWKVREYARVTEGPERKRKQRKKESKCQSNRRQVELFFLDNIPHLFHRTTELHKALTSGKKRETQKSLPFHKRHSHSTDTHSPQSFHPRPRPQSHLYLSPSRQQTRRCCAFVGVRGGIVRDVQEVHRRRV